MKTQEGTEGDERVLFYCGHSGRGWRGNGRKRTTGRGIIFRVEEIKQCLFDRARLIINAVVAEFNDRLGNWWISSSEKYSETITSGIDRRGPPSFPISVSQIKGKWKRG